MAIVVPLLFLAVFIFAAVKKVNIYRCFTRGIGEAVQFMLSLLPMLCAIFMMCELFERSGLSDRFSQALSPVLSAVGIPTELAKLILMKPFSGSGSLTYLNRIIAEYGADSYVARCACVLYGSSETVFYVSAVYFSSVKGKKLFSVIVVVLLANFLAAVAACLLCKIM